MQVADLFPVCQAVGCPLRGQHKHLLPTQLALIHSTEKYVLSVGGYRSGKTLAACALCLLLMLAVPGNRVFIGRRSYVKMHDSTLRIFLEILERAAEVDEALKGTRYLERFSSFPHRLVLPNDSEVIFRETKDVGRHLGPEYGVVYLDEAQEEPEDSFTKLMGRLALPRAAGALKFILTTNPTHKNWWGYRRFGLEPGHIELPAAVGPPTTYRHIRSSPRDNPHLPADYIRDLLTLDPNEIRRVVEGLPGFEPDGPAVYPFKHERHVGVPDLLPVGLLRQWDFGFRHPACTWAQFYRCKRRTVHYQVLHELDAQQVEAEQLAKAVLDATKQMFPTVPQGMTLEVGDAQGAAVSDKGPGPIITLSRPPYNLRFRYRKVSDIDPGLELVRKLMNARCECGVPVFIVHRRCRSLIDALAGGYHYPRERKPNDKPIKDGFYDDYADTVRYGCDVMVRAEMLDPDWFDALVEAPQGWAVGRPGWAWMERPVTPEQIRADIEAAKSGRPN